MIGECTVLLNNIDDTKNFEVGMMIKGFGIVTSVDRNYGIMTFHSGIRTEDGRYLNYTDHNDIRLKAIKRCEESLKDWQRQVDEIERLSK